jgi:hypothetical protein
VADAAVLAWLAVLVFARARAAWRLRQVGALLWLAAIAEALWFARPYAAQVTILSGGDDWLTYEHLGRAIIGDPLLRQPGPAAGQGTAFYFQPLYPYFLALAHLAFGESLFGAVLVQRLLVAAAAGWTAAMSKRLFGDAAGWIALIAGGIFLYVKLGRWSGVFLAESLFTPLLVAWAWLLVRAATEPTSAARLVLTGAVGGIATLLRTTLFVAWPLVLPLWAVALRHRRIGSTAIVVAAMLAVAGTLTVRTWIVTGAGAMAPSSGGIALLVGNTPAATLAAAPAAREAAYERLGLAPQTRVVAEYAFQRPSEFFGNLGRKALYSAGLFRLSGIEGTGIRVGAFSLWYLGMWVAALAGVFLMLRSHERPSAVAWIPGALALTHFAVMVAFLPNVYGDRQILPGYPLLIPYAAVAAVPLVAWTRRHETAAAAIVLPALTLLVFLPASSAVSDVITFATASPWRHYVLLAATAIAVSRLATSSIVQRAVLTALVIGPFVTRPAFNRFAAESSRDPFPWVVAAMLLVPAAFLARGRFMRPRTAAAAAIALLVLALVMPFLPGGDGGLAGELSDIRRGLANAVSGNEESRRELMIDVRSLAGDALEPVTTAAAIVARGYPLAALAIVAGLVLARFRRRAREVPSATAP